MNCVTKTNCHSPSPHHYHSISSNLLFLLTLSFFFLSSVSSFFSYSLVSPLSCSPFLLLFLSYLSLAATLYFSLVHSFFLSLLLSCPHFFLFDLFLSIVTSPSYLFFLLHSLPHSPTHSLFSCPYFLFIFFILEFTPCKAEQPLQAI